MVTTEVLQTALGECYRVSRIFPTVASASHAARLLGAVVPEGFDPRPAPAPVQEAVQASPPLPDPEREDDTGEPYTVPGCANGLCGMD